MILRKIIQGNTFINETVSGIFPHIESPTLVDGYEDVTSIHSWALYGYLTGHDHKYIREQIKILMLQKTNNAQDLTLLSESEKMYCSWFLVVPFSFAHDYYNNSLRFESNLQLWVNYQKESRTARFTIAKALVFSQLQNIEAMTILKEITLNGLDTAYTEGIEGTANDGVTGLFDYVESTDIFVNSGLSSKPYQPSTFPTMQDLAIAVMDILRGGNYFLTDKEIKRFKYV